MTLYRTLFLVSTISILNVINSYAQAQLEAMNTEYDFGDIQEYQGSVKHTFEIKNTGNLPLIITEVKPSCGCTTPFWTQDEISPNQKGTIVAEFNPLGRPGTFKKSLTVSSNSATGKEYLFIAGNVIPKPKKFTDNFPIVKGNIYLKQNLFNIGEIKNNKTETKTFEYYNNSNNPITFIKNNKLPEHISITFNTKTVKPKSIGKLTITYNASKANDLGFVTNIVDITTDDTIMPLKKMTIFADVKLYFPKLSEIEQKKQPKIEFDTLLHDFGKVKENGTLKHTFTFKNKGKKPLKIIKYQPSCSCLNIKIEKKEIKANENGKIEVIFNTKGRLGNQSKTIELYINDPINPIPTLTLKTHLIK